MTQTNPDSKTVKPSGPWRIGLAILLLALVPVFFLFCTRDLNEKRGPLWLGSNSDPTYCYLFNSLLILNDQPTYLIEHPGTTAQLGGAAILRVRYPFLSQDKLTEQVLTQPETALELIISSINGVTSILLFGFGLLHWRRFHDLPTALLLQSALLFFRQTYTNSVFFSPEIFFPPLGLFLAYIYFTAHEHKSPTYWALTAGLLAALCLMVKYTFLPFLALGFFAFRSRGAKGVYLATFLVVLGAFVYFIHHELARTWLWVRNLATHSGQYGGGPQQVVDWTSYFPILLNMLKADPLYIPLLATGLVGPLLTLVKWPWRVAFNDRTNRLLVSLTALEACCFIITAKHPAVHYLTPVVAMAPLHILLLSKLVGSLVPHPQIKAALCLFVLAGGLYAGFNKYESNSANYARFVVNQMEGRAKLATWLAAKDPAAGYFPVYYYRNSSVEYSLYFGNGYARSYFSPLLKKLYPDVWFFNVFNARFQSYTEMITGEVFYARHPHPVFLGSNTIEAMPFDLVFPLPQNGTLKRMWYNAEVYIHEIQYQ